MVEARKQRPVELSPSRGWMFITPVCYSDVTTSGATAGPFAGPFCFTNPNAP